MDMARYQLILAYDGTHFLGFQRSGGSRTVQGEVEAALRRIGWQQETILYAGRTDSGVHASGQVIAFDLAWGHSPEELVQALNANLPDDVAARSARQAQPDFHPRYHATGRTYHYRIYCQPHRDPLLDRFAWRVWPAVDEQRLHQAAKLLPGTYDFAAFGTPPRAGGSTVRIVTKAVWRPQAQGLLFEISANAFLYHMVRRLVFWQILVGQARLELEQLALAVEAAQPQTPGLAPPNGLFLAEVSYPGQEERS
jgi:tRNA pseudouridine38-40 synthase